MPPVTQQGSRAGLITAVVVFVILFITSAIFAIYFGVELSNTRDELQAMEREFGEVVTRQGMAGPDVRALVDIRRQEGTGFTTQMTAMDVAIAQRNRLARVITGQETAAADARAAAEQALQNVAQAVQQTGITMPAQGENLVGAVQALGNAITNQHAEVQSLQRQLESTRNELVQTSQRMEEALAAKDQQIQQVRQETQQIVQLATDDRAGGRQVLQQIEQARERERRLAQEAQSQMQVQLATLQRDTQRLQQELETTRARLLGRRVDVGESIIRQPDGQIIRIPGGNIAIINLGQGDQVSPGLTFEVYDRAQGVPPLGEGEDDLPQGKASIEVIRVGPTSSEARIIRQQPGTMLMQGDLIVNLVYDRHTRFNFVVYGDFDITQPGRATSADAEIIRRLVTQWGAQVVDEIDVQTDFLVMGAEPQLPDYDPDDPIERQAFLTAQDRLEQYYDTLRRAQELHIPILNQNRFLYFTGYYAHARR